MKREERALALARVLELAKLTLRELAQLGVDLSQPSVRRAGAELGAELAELVVRGGIMSIPRVELDCSWIPVEGPRVGLGDVLEVLAEEQARCAEISSRARAESSV